MLKDFALKFIRRFSETSNYLYENKKSDLYESIPQVLSTVDANVHAAYSDDKSHIMFRFNKSNEFRFKADRVSGDVSNILDPYKRWPTNQAGFKIADSNATINGGKITGMRPFIIEGDSVEVFITNLEFDGSPFIKNYIDYCIILSYSKFLEVYKDINAYVAQITSVYLEYQVQNDDKNDYLRNLYSVKRKMEELISDENTGELKIDNFIKENPIILRVGLSLEPKTFLHSKPMRDVHGDNIKEFIPDLVAFCFEDLNWKIVDYKKAYNSIIKNSGRERTTFRASVPLLLSQLRDYLKYFEDKLQMKDYNATYKVDIKNPGAIGIIGNINNDEIDDFNLLKRDLQGHIKIVPYNFLYDSFVRFIERTEKLIK